MAATGVMAATGRTAATAHTAATGVMAAMGRTAVTDSTAAMDRTDRGENPRATTHAGANGDVAMRLARPQVGNSAAQACAFGTTTRPRGKRHGLALARMATLAVFGLLIAAAP